MQMMVSSFDNHKNFRAVTKPSSKVPKLSNGITGRSRLWLFIQHSLLNRRDLAHHQVVVSVDVRLEMENNWPHLSPECNLRGGCVRKTGFGAEMDVGAGEASCGRHPWVGEVKLN